jgi:hypothetical protein
MLELVYCIMFDYVQIKVVLLSTIAESQFTTLTVSDYVTLY